MRAEATTLAHLDEAEFLTVRCQNCQLRLIRCLYRQLLVKPRGWTSDDPSDPVRRLRFVAREPRTGSGVSVEERILGEGATRYYWRIRCRCGRDENVTFLTVRDGHEIRGKLFDYPVVYEAGENVIYL
jgi:hypothetical protein